MEPLIKACLAATLIVPDAPQYSASYHWCKNNEHPMPHPGPIPVHPLHECYCGVWWTCGEEDMVELTPNMLLWRTGTEEQIHAVRGHLMG